jgi:hypothetical protein
MLNQDTGQVDNPLSGPDHIHPWWGVAITDRSDSFTAKTAAGWISGNTGRSDQSAGSAAATAPSPVIASTS